MTTKSIYECYSQLKYLSSLWCSSLQKARKKYFLVSDVICNQYTMSGCNRNTLTIVVK